MLQTWLPSAQWSHHLASSTVITKLEETPKPEACQASATTEPPSVPCVFYLCLRFLREHHMHRGDAGYQRSQRKDAVVLSKATASNLALESREDRLHAPVEGRGWEAWALC